MSCPGNMSPTGNVVVWITGLSGAGKTTLATEVVTELRSRGCSVLMLDGDDLRNILGAADGGHDRASRFHLAMRYSRLCQMLGRQGINVVIATISLFSDVHLWNRENIPGYFEVYLKVPVDELRRRDPKGIYRKFDAGQIKSIAGLDLAIEEPKNPDMLVEFDNRVSVRDVASRIIEQANCRTKI